jgi:hypothetical protein
MVLLVGAINSRPHSLQVRIKVFSDVSFSGFDIKPLRFTIDSITVFAPPNGVSLLATIFHVSNAALFEMDTLK